MPVFTDPVFAGIGVASMVDCQQVRQASSLSSNPLIKIENTLGSYASQE